MHYGALARPKNWAPPLHSKLYWPYSTTLISESAKYRNLKKYVIEIFKDKIGLLSDLISDIFDFIEKPYSLRINSQFRPENKIWHRNIKKYDIECFSK